MADNLVTVTIPTDSGIPADAVVNTWSFFTATAKDPVAGGLIATALQTFYNNFDDNLSIHLANNATVRFYDRADASPRVPWLAAPLLLVTATSGFPLPEEVAYVLSFQAQPVSGAIMARRRGRIYIGPLMTAASGADARPTNALRDAVRGAAGTLLADSLSSASWTWNVWSSKDNAGREVQSGWVDNSFDTQRRRGRAATSRSVFPG